MVAPVLLAAGISAGASLGGGLFGALANNRANARNQAIDIANMQRADRERFQNLYMALRADSDAKLGSRDAQGNRTRFIPGVGYVTEPSDQVQTLINASNAEELRQLTGDAADNRTIRQGAQRRSLMSGMTADSLHRQFEDTVPGVRADEERALNATSDRAFNEAYDNSQNAALGTSIRQGMGSDAIADVIARVGQDRARGLRETRTGNRAAGEALVTDRYNRERGTNADLLSLFSGMASGAPAGAPGRSSVGSDANAALGLAMNRGAQGPALIANALSRPGGRQSFVVPNDGFAQALGITGNTMQNFIPYAMGSMSNNNAQSSLTSALTNRGM